MKRKDGERRKDYQYNLDELIVDLLRDKPRTVYKMKEMLNKTYGKKLGWITIKRHVGYLLHNKVISIYYEGGEGKKKIRVYKLGV